MTDFETLFDAIGARMGRDTERAVRKIAADLPVQPPGSESREARLAEALRERDEHERDSNEALLAIAHENTGLRADVAALVKWASDKADGTVKYTDDELRRVTALLAPDARPPSPEKQRGDKT